MSSVLLLVRLLLALVFLVAGLAKLADLAGSRQALRDFGVPPRLSTPFGVLLPLAELAVAVALVPSSSAWWAAVGALVLLLLFVAGISSNLARGRTPDCHCFGQLHFAPAGPSTLIRNLLLALLAGLVVGFGRSQVGLSALDGIGAWTVAQRAELLGFLVLLAGLTGSGWLVWQMLQQQGRLLLRLEALEESIAGGNQAGPPTGGHEARAGLQVFTPAPTLRLAGMPGEEFTPETLEAKPKVFGLGLNKTGTTSLTAALRLLGYHAVHCPKDEGTQLEIYRFFAAGSEVLHLAVLQDLDAITDTPVCCLYKALDSSYPGSKFVLTVREKHAWLRSYHLLWEQLAPLRGVASDGLLAHYFRFLNEKLYGTQNTEPEILSQAYDTYTAEVIEYFRERPNDLLILDICSGEGWNKLAPFLGVPIPEVPFPWEHRARTIQDEEKREAGDTMKRHYQEAELSGHVS